MISVERDFYGGGGVKKHFFKHLCLNDYAELGSKISYNVLT